MGGVGRAGNVGRGAIQGGVVTGIGLLGLEKGREIAARGQTADLLIANNVLAHVPDLNDFVAGMHALLRPTGIASIEFPHLLRLMEETQFDTIYHEHYSYFALLTVKIVFAAHGLELFDVEETPPTGGSLRLPARQEGDRPRALTPRLAARSPRDADSGPARNQPPQSPAAVRSLRTAPPAAPRRRSSSACCPRPSDSSSRATQLPAPASPPRPRPGNGDRPRGVLCMAR